MVQNYVRWIDSRMAPLPVSSLPNDVHFKVRMTDIKGLSKLNRKVKEMKADLNLKWKRLKADRSVAKNIKWKAFNMLQMKCETKKRVVRSWFIAAVAARLEVTCARYVQVDCCANPVEGISVKFGQLSFHN